MLSSHPNAIRINLKRVFGPYPQTLEDVYMLYGDSITVFNAPGFGSLKLREEGSGSLEINFPANPTNNIRFWQLRFYYVDSYQYDRDDEEYFRPIGTTKRPKAVLNFLQLTDTVYSEQVIENLCRTYEHRLPPLDKPRHPDASVE